MLKYRQYLEQSRARRGTAEFPNHYSQQLNNYPKDNQNIKQLVSNPNYGQIFYSEDKKPPENNEDLSQQLKLQQAKNIEFKAYARQLQQQNSILKSKVSDRMSPSNSKKSLNQGNIQFNQQIEFKRIQDDQQPNYITSKIPSQKTFDQNQAQHIPFRSSSYNDINREPLPSIPEENHSQFYPGPQNPSNSHIRPIFQTIKSIPIHSNNNISYKKIDPMKPAQIFEQNIQHKNEFAYNYLKTVQSQQQNHNLFELQNLDQRLSPQHSNQWKRNTISTSIQRNPRDDLLGLAKRKLYQLKQDDQELRNYTIKLLKKPY